MILSEKSATFRDHALCRNHTATVRHASRPPPPESRQPLRAASAGNRMSTATQTSSPPRPSSPPRRSALSRALRLLVLVLALLVLLPYALTPLYRLVDPVSTLMLWRWAKRARVERTVVPIERMGPALPRAVIVAEDDRFCS